MSAVARSHFVPDAVEFMPMIGLPPGAANRPTWDQLVEIGRLTGAAPDGLVERVLSAAKTPVDKVTLGGVFVDAKCGAAFRICPACVALDMSSENAADPVDATWERMIWLAPDYDLCHIHQIPIVETPVAPGFHVSVAGAGTFVPREPVEGYQASLGEYMARSLHEKVWPIPALKGLRLRAVIQTCQIIGTLDRYGAGYPQVTEIMERWSVADRGYALIRQGDQAVDKVFDTAITQSDGTDLHSIFGKPLVHKLSVAGREKTYTYLRQKFVAAAHRGRLYGKSVTSLLGLPAPSASGWTLHELTVHFSKGPAVLTDLLVDLGHDRDSIGRSILPDETADQLEPFRHSVTRSQAAARLGIAEKVLGELVRSGILTPLATRNSTDGKCLEFYSPSDIERARTVIFDNCTGVFGAGGAPFAMAAGLVGRSTTTLMSLLTRGSCSWASLPKGATKIGQIHIQVETLRAAVRGDDAPLGVEMAAGLLGLGRSTVMALIKTGRLSRGIGTNPVNLRKQVCIDRDELARLAVDHVSARTLSDSLPSRAKMINRYLDHLGVAHIGDGIRLYAWTDLERALLVMRCDGLTDALRTAAVDFHFRN